jgi:hypothetical protein
MVLGAIATAAAFAVAAHCLMTLLRAPRWLRALPTMPGWVNHALTFGAVAALVGGAVFGAYAVDRLWPAPPGRSRGKRR